jgi:hypothetical protein
LTNKVNEANKANKAVVVANTAYELDKLDEANKANVANKVNKSNKANEASLPKANKLLANNHFAVVIIKYSSKLLLHDGDVIDLFLFFLFSLTIYSTIVAEVKGYFGVIEIGL